MTDFVQPIPSLFAWPAANESEHLWGKLGSLYGDVLQRSWQEWLNTSAQIVQQQAMRAFAETSQALLENATQLQQKAWGRLIDTNQQAAAIMADGVARATTAAVHQAATQAGQAAAQAAGAVTDAMTDAVKGGARGASE